MHENDKRHTEIGPSFRDGRWFAVNLRANFERAALANLARQGFCSFLPARLKTVRHARQFHTSAAPLFPGYLFVWLDLSRLPWRRVNSTHGVVSLVMAGNEPVPVPPGVVESLIEMSSEKGIVYFNRELQEGQKVRIQSGPFAEQLGTLEQLGDRDRVQVLLEMMGANVRIATSASQLAPA